MLSRDCGKSIVLLITKRCGTKSFMATLEGIMTNAAAVFKALVLILLLPACVSGGTSIAHLELCYATSVSEPEDMYGPENVFDGDPNTCWLTMPGAAPDEGLFFTFEEPLYISSILVSMAPKSSNLEQITLYQLYVNGYQTSTFHPGDIANIDSYVKSIFIQIKETASMDIYSIGIRYHRDLPVGISEVTLYVEDDTGTEVPLQVCSIMKVDGNVGASSCLEPSEAYCPEFLFDSRPAFGWADGNENHSGEGENLVFTFDTPQRIEKIKIWNGYHRSESHFQQNERAAEISFGHYYEEPGLYRLEDVMDPQVITLETPLEGDHFMLGFLEIYPGEIYSDLVISELRFFNGEEWFVIDPYQEEIWKQSVLDWAQGNNAARFIDRQVHYRGDLEDGDFAQSIILRSNGSFVLWKSSNRGDGGETMYADGNWQVLNDSTLRIFGKLQRVPDYQQVTYDPYSGVRQDFLPEDNTRTTIFSDTLHFGDGWLSSVRGLFEDFSF
jgi:hypothetical protein